MPNQRAPNPKRRSERAHRAILKAAMKLCREQGYANLSMDAIAAQAGVGKQTIYRWWPSKGTLMVEAVFEEALPRVRFEPTGEFEHDLRRQLRSTVSVMTEPDFGPQIAELVGEAQLNPAVAEHLAQQLVRPLRNLNRTHLQNAQKQGLMRRNVDVDLAADMLFGPLWLRFLLTKAPLSAEYADALVDAVLNGLRPKKR